MRGFSEKYKTIFPIRLNNTKYRILIKLITNPKIPHNCCYAFGFLKLNIMYNLSINPEKWVKMSDLELEMNKPFWFKKPDGKIVMGAPYSNGYSSGIAEVYLAEDGLKIKTNTFLILRDSQVQEVLEADA